MIEEFCNPHEAHEAIHQLAEWLEIEHKAAHEKSICAENANAILYHAGQRNALKRVIDWLHA